MTRSIDRDSSGETLVVCAICESVVAMESAEAQWVSIQDKPTRVWICEICTRLGRGNQARKYVMKQEKTGSGWQRP